MTIYVCYLSFKMVMIHADGIEISFENSNINGIYPNKGKAVYGFCKGTRNSLEKKVFDHILKCFPHANRIMLVRVIHQGMKYDSRR